jgi:phosphopentomutase
MTERSGLLVVLIILDGLGVGELPDAARFGDAGSNTLGNLADAVGGLDLPNLESAGLGNVIPARGLDAQSDPVASYGKMCELSQGKDSTSGHWEIMGYPVEKPFPLFPDGFPEVVIREFERLTGKGVIGNRAASGTEIIEELGPEHLKTGKLIVYTSADSVFQIAAHKEVVPLPELYKICRIAREILSGDFEVSRVIARPFEGEIGSFVRTPERKDLSVTPRGRTVLDILRENGVEAWGVGKVDQLFGGRGFSRTHSTRDNRHGIDMTLRCMEEIEIGLIFTNLIDFDMLWGHRNDTTGFYGGLREFDHALPALRTGIQDRGFMIITADHGCDPTAPSTDHSREYVPLLVFDGYRDGGRNLGTRRTFADVGATLGEMFGVDRPAHGKSFYASLPSFQRHSGRI